MECLQHDFEGNFFFGILFFYFLGCNIRLFPSSSSTSSSDSNEQFCMFDSQTGERPATKGEAIESGMVGGSVIGTAGIVTASQIGMYVCMYVCIYVCVYEGMCTYMYI
jgi:hypothetical protein